MTIDHDTTDPIDPADKHAVDSIIEAARAGHPVEQIELGNIYTRARADGGVDVIDLTGQQHIDALNRIDRRLGIPPARKTGTLVLTEPSSFIAYVNKHSLGDATELCGNRDKGDVVALLNGHGLTDAGWGDHKAVLEMTPTRSWKAWTTASGKFGDQTDFAEFLEDHAPDVVDPDAATLIEIATTMQANTSVAWKSGVRLHDGTVQLGYEETSEATAGTRGQLSIPSTITLALSPYEGVDPYKITARLRYRMRDGKLTIGVILDRADDVLRAAFGDIVEQIEAETAHTVLHGRIGTR